MLVQGTPVNPVEWWDAHWMQDRVNRKITEAGGALGLEFHLDTANPSGDKIVKGSTDRAGHHAQHAVHDRNHGGERGPKTDRSLGRDSSISRNNGMKINPAAIQLTPKEFRRLADRKSPDALSPTPPCGRLNGRCAHEVEVQRGSLYAERLGL